MTEKKLLTTKEVAKILGIKPNTLERQRHFGVGLPYVKVGHLVRYHAEVIPTYQAEQN